MSYLHQFRDDKRNQKGYPIRGIHLHKDFFMLDIILLD